jgi:2-methylaconitate cis-trans-isomerase PrpF
MKAITATWMRGGTSKCWVFEWENLQVDGKTVDEVLLRLFGSPDSRQVDGVGGGTSTTSKAVIIKPSPDDDSDVHFTFAQVGIDEHRVDWGSNCGNCSATVAPYAIARGWVQPQTDETTVRAFNTNTDQTIIQKVATPGGVLPESGDQMIPGVPFPGLAVRLGFLDPAGRTTGHLLPTGNHKDVLDFAGQSIDSTLIDAGAPVVIVSAESLNLPNAQALTERTDLPDLLAKLDTLRREGAVTMGLVSTPAEAQRAIPKLAIVSPGSESGDEDLVVQMLSMGQPHPALPVTGSVALTMAAQEPGTVLHDLLTRDTSTGLALNTPAGMVQTWIDTDQGVPTVGTLRTARTLANATLPLPDTW